MIRKRKKEIFIKSNRINLFFSILSGVLMTVNRLSIAWVLQNITDFISGKCIFSLSDILIVTILSFVIMAIAIILDCQFSPKFSALALMQYKNYIFSKIFKKSLDSFYDEELSTYLSVLTSDLGKIKNDYLDQIGAFTQVITALIGSVIMMAITNPLLAIISLLISLIPLLVAVNNGKSISKYEYQLSLKNANYVLFVKEALAGFSVIKSFKSEQRVIDNHYNKNSEQSDSLKQRERIVTVVDSTSHFLGNFVQIAIFIVSAVLCRQDSNITPGVVILFIQLMNSVIGPIEQIPRMLTNRKGIFSLIDSHEAMLNRNINEDGRKSLDEEKIDISVRNMSYSYDGKIDALKDINIDFEAGKCYLIVGDSGSGKTTLLNVLSSIARNYRGSIKYCKTELNDISKSSLYENISMIQQDVFIFNDTIINNITMFEEFENSDIEKAILLSGLEGIIQEKGYDYTCGENGNNLSGGEKQRISIARCILRKQKVIFIDEGTSALDIETAKKINASLLNLEGKTRIIVSHNFDTNLIKECDEIIVLRNGMISEKGSFNQLVQRKSYFYALYVLATESDN